MSSEFNGAVHSGERLNQYALVIYFPDPLARFLDELRLELVKGCRPRAHVTVLPPRPLQNLDAATEQGRAMAVEFPPFEIAAGDVEIFSKTNVIYIGVARGAEQLRCMHDAMNAAALHYNEPYQYHPHITLAQEFDPAETERLFARARERWAEYRGPRALHAERMAFVQNTQGNCWLDLAEFGLGAMSPVRRCK
jgi:2'-5' RNA ligase